jgi:K+-transporting ATPase ATPase C chain
MKRHLVTACLYTAITAVLLGIVYPLVITGSAHLAFPAQAFGELVRQNGVVIGSRLIGQLFTRTPLFSLRPSAAGNGYDASASSGSNLGPTSKVLMQRIAQSVAGEKTAGSISVNLATASGSGLDPDISPAAACYQVPRASRATGVTEDALRALVATHITGRELGLLGEPRVNVLELNVALEALDQKGSAASR